MKKIGTVVFFILLSGSLWSQQLPSYVPVNGLTGWYPLSSATQARDLSANGNNGQVDRVEGRAITHQEDRFGIATGAMLVSQDDTLTIGVPPDYALSSAFSVGAWCNNKSPDAPSQAILTKTGPGGQVLVGLIQNSKELYYSFEMRTDTAVVVRSTADALNLSGWHFVAGTFDGQTMRLYVDGAASGEKTLTNEDVARYRKNMTNDKNPILAGRIATLPQERFVGTLDDLFIYSRALSVPEVKQLFESGSSAATLFQTSGFTLESLNDNADNVKFPEFHSAVKPRTADIINKSLQIGEYHIVNSNKNPDAAAEYGHDWTFGVAMPTSRLLTVSLIRHTIDETQPDRPIIKYITQYYFDAQNGDRIYMTDFFTTEGFKQIRNLGNAVLFRAIEEDRSLPPEYACRKIVDDSWDQNRIRMTVNPYSRDFRFETDGCEVKKYGDDYPSGVVPWAKILPALSPVGRYYLDNGPEVALTEPGHVWSGTINGKIPVTLMLRVTQEGVVTGEEVYNNIGQSSIRLKGTFRNGLLKISELDPKTNAPMADIEASVQGRSLTGTWKKAQGKKTFTFSAAIGGE